MVNPRSRSDGGLWWWPTSSSIRTIQAFGSEDILEMRDSVRRSGFSELRTLREKTRRSLDMPYVLVQGHILKYLEFHVFAVRCGVLHVLKLMNQPVRISPC